MGEWVPVKALASACALFVTGMLVGTAVGVWLAWRRPPGEKRGAH